jgi:protease-4
MGLKKYMQETSSEQNSQIASVLIQDLLKEKQADRRWKNIRFFAWFLLIGYMLIGIFMFLRGSPEETRLASTKKYVALIRLEGMIAPDRDFSSETLIPVLKKAFEDKNAEGVIIDINSPGGTPVQAGIIHDAIVRFKKEFKKRVVIVGEDLLTSGAYYVAVSGDKIYVNPNTITGSIGVIMKGFGFVELMKKIGVERRVYMAGSDKDRLDPFLPQTPEDLAKIQSVISEVHENFVQAVLQGRQGKLHADPSILFSGDFWSGQSALKLGLVDGLGDMMDVMDKEFQTTNYKEYETSSNFFRTLGGKIGTTFDSFAYSY